MTISHPRVVIGAVAFLLVFLAALISGQLTGYGLGFEHPDSSYGLWVGSDTSYCYLSTSPVTHAGCETAQ